jgi:predicted  nucleic acid-binding Zn-ribbon protein
MNIRPDLMQRLRQLAELDEARPALKPKSSKLTALDAEIEEVRQLLPTAVTNHYDQCRSRKKPAIAPVRRGICGGCHLSMTRGSYENLRRNTSALHVCENCGVFIYLDEIDAPGSAIPSKR